MKKFLGGNMDTILADAIIDLKVPYFGSNLKNKGDSQSCMFDPRKLLSKPWLLKHIGKKTAHIINKKLKVDAIIGLATSGIAWGCIASLYSGMPFLYVRKKLEKQMSAKFIEGITENVRKVVLVDDLLFAGESKKETIEILNEHNIEVTDIIVIIDRQLERVKDGPSLSKRYHVTVHSLITMEELVNYMIEINAITNEQLRLLIQDYKQYDRWYLPRFAK